MYKVLIGIYILLWILTTIYAIYIEVKHRKKYSQLSQEGHNLRYGKSSESFIPLGIYLILISIPFFTKYNDLSKETVPTLVALVFFILGIIFLFFGIKGHLKKQRVSRKLVIEDENLKPNGRLRGRLIYKGLTMKERKPVKVHLILQKVYILSMTNEKNFLEKAVWSETTVSHPYSYKDYIEIPFYFKIDEKFPDNWEDGYELVLTVEDENIGIGVDTIIIKSKGNAIKDVSLDDVLEEPITKDAKSSLEILAYSRSKNKILNLLSILFVIAFSIFFWMMFRYKGQSLEQLKIQIFYTLIYGLFTTLIFFVPLYLYIKSFNNSNSKEKKKKIILFTRFLCGLVFLSFAFSGFVIANVLMGNKEILDKLFYFTFNYFIDGILGMFFILGMYALIKTSIADDNGNY